MTLPYNGVCDKLQFTNSVYHKKLSLASQRFHAKMGLQSGKWVL